MKIFIYSNLKDATTDVNESAQKLDNFNFI
jgi:hypothetical protein